MQSDREEAAIGAAEEMAEATRRVREAAWMLAGTTAVPAISATEADAAAEQAAGPS